MLVTFNEVPETFRKKTLFYINLINISLTRLSPKPYQNTINTYTRTQYSYATHSPVRFYLLYRAAIHICVARRVNIQSTKSITFHVILSRIMPLSI